MSIAVWVERYVGIPYSDDGLGFSECSCWGLVRLVFLTEHRIELPTYAEISAANVVAISHKMADAADLDPWLPVARGPRAFDVVRMRTGRDYRHVGIMVDDVNVLHVEKSTAAVCVPIDHPSIRFRLAGTFRHKELA